VLPLGRGETVLLVESEQEGRLRDEEMLAALRYGPVGFEDPADAIALPILIRKTKILNNKPYQAITTLHCNIYPSSN
jgi:hypothetical protein